MVDVAVVSFRLGGSDGVAIEAAKWIEALRALGANVRTVAADGPVDVQVEGLGIRDTRPLDHRRLAAALEAEVVLVENLCSLPLNPNAAATVAQLLAGRASVFHHHDLPWQRPTTAEFPAPPDDPSWVHATINELSRNELEARGISATTIYNRFDPDPPRGDRRGTRAALGVDDDVLLLAQPTRALGRKRVDLGLACAEELGATYWLLGDAEDGYDEALADLVAAARCPVLLGAPPLQGWTMDDAYAACDVVVMPSDWEGFGNPVLESATHRKPLVLQRYPVALELEAFGFSWFGLDQLDELRRATPAELEWRSEHNASVARTHFGLDGLPQALAELLAPLPTSLGQAVPESGR